MYKIIKHFRCNEILTEEFLQEQLVTKGLYMYEVAKLVGCSSETIRIYAKNFNIIPKPLFKWYRIITREFLWQEYIIKKQTLKEIAKTVGCAWGIIRTLLIKYNIPRRSMSEAQIGKKYSKERNRKSGKSRKGKKLNIEPKIKEEKNKKISKALKNKPKPEGFGKRCHFYKGGISPLHALIRVLPEEKNWIKECLKRDNYTCQECDSKENLEVHHIKEFSKIFVEFLQLYSQFSPIEDKETLIRLATTYMPFYELINGKTLCYDCHNLIHTKVNKKL
jgi:DNA-binding transcriptional MerR regulator